MGNGGGAGGVNARELPPWVEERTSAPPSCISATPSPPYSQVTAAPQAAGQQAARRGTTRTRGAPVQHESRDVKDGIPGGHHAQHHGCCQAQPLPGRQSARAPGAVQVTAVACGAARAVQQQRWRGRQQHPQDRHRQVCLGQQQHGQFGGVGALQGPGCQVADGACFVQVASQSQAQRCRGQRGGRVVGGGELVGCVIRLELIIGAHEY